MKERVFIVLLALLAGTVVIAPAATFNNGAGDHDFNNPLNWIGEIMPDIGEDAIISGGHFAETTDSYGTTGTASPWGWVLTVGDNGSTGSLKVNAGHTITNGSRRDLKVGDGTGSAGIVDIYGTLKMSGSYADAFIGPNGGNGIVSVYDGGTLRVDKKITINGGTLYYEAYAAKSGSSYPQNSVIVDDAGTIAFETDGSNVATVECSAANLDLAPGSTLEMNLSGAFNIGDSWTVITGVTGMPTEAAFGGISSPQGYGFSADYDMEAGTVTATLTDASVIAVAPASSRITPVDTILEWAQGSADTIYGYTVYFGQNPEALTDITVDSQTTSVDPSPAGDLEYGTTYYYRIDALEPNAPGPDITVTGGLWKFTTEPPTPSLISSSASLTVVSGATAEFSVVTNNATNFEWYKQGDPTVITDDGADISGAATDTLTIANVEQADEGYYYCIIGNDLSEVTHESTPAFLMTERLVGHWEFNGTLDDSEGLLAGQFFDPNILSVVAPTYVSDEDSIDGSAAFYDDGKHVQVLGSEDLYEFFINGITISAWIKTSQVNAYATIAGKQDPDNTKGFLLRASSGASFSIKDATQAQANHDPNNVDGQWHQITGTFDGQFVKIYVDGHLGETTDENVNVIDPSGALLTIGAAKTDGSGPFGGLIDDVKIWSYALDHDTIAQTYADISGNDACKTYPVGDITEDCIVNLEDFAELAGEWMISYLVDPEN